MTLIAAIAVGMALTGQQAKPPAVPFAGSQAEYPADVKAWGKWGALNQPVQPSFPLPASPELPAPTDGAPVWRTKVFVVPGMDVRVQDGEGGIRFRRTEMEVAQTGAILTAAKRLAGIEALRTGGAVRVAVDVEVWNDTARPTQDAGGDDQFQAWIARFIAPRFNGGLYDAEDRVFRGPYGNVIVVVPSAPANSAPFLVNGTWVQVVPYWTNADHLEPALSAAWDATANQRAAEWGFPRGIPNDAFAEFAATPTVDSARRLARLAVPPPDPTRIPLPDPTLGVSSASYRLGLSDQGDKGPVLEVREQSLGRYGGVDLPGFESTTQGSLQFSAMSKSHDPFAVELVAADGTVAATVLGFDRGPGSASAVPFRYDGTWQTVRVPVPASGKYQVRITPSLGGLVYGKAVLEPHILYLSDFALVSEAATLLPAPGPNLASAEVAERLAAARTATDNDQVLKALQDPAREVAATALGRVTATPNAAIRQQVMRMVNSIDPWVGAMAVDTLGTFSGDDVHPALLNALKFAITDSARAHAAMALAKSPDSTTAGEIMVLATGRSPSARLQAVGALGLIPGREAGIIRMAFIQLSDPGVKLAVTDFANPQDEYDARKLLWSAVNETSDAVRLASAIKLIQSPVEAFRADGYKIIRDDSYFVRREFARYLAEHPSEAHRGALRIGVTDADPIVRATSLHGLAALPDPVKPEEVQNVFTDVSPDVQVALIALARAKGIELPAATRDRMAASPDPRVTAALRDLGESAAPG